MACPDATRENPCPWPHRRHQQRTACDAASVRRFNTGVRCTQVVPYTTGPMAMRLASLLPNLNHMCIDEATCCFGGMTDDFATAIAASCPQLSTLEVAFTRYSLPSEVGVEWEVVEGMGKTSWRVRGALRERPRTCHQGTVREAVMCLSLPTGTPRIFTSSSAPVSTALDRSHLPCGGFPLTSSSRPRPLVRCHSRHYILLHGLHHSISSSVPTEP